MSNTPVCGQSAEVRLSILLGDGNRLTLSQIGPDCAVFAGAIEVSAGPAVVEMMVDGRVRRWPVTILRNESGPSTTVGIRGN